MASECGEFEKKLLTLQMEIKNGDALVVQWIE